MSNYAGVVLPQSSLQFLAKGQTGTLLANVYPRPTRGAPMQAYGNPAPVLASESPAHGPGSRQFPYALTPAHRSAVAALLFGTYSDDLFNHFLLIPSVEPLGNLLSNQSRVITIGNLFSTSQELVSVTNDVDAGVTFVGLPALPVTIPPFGSLSFTVLVSTAGPPTVNGDVVIVVAAVGGASPQTLQVLFTGNRITLFPYDPEQGYTEELQWKTDILESYEGTEQRIKLRQHPRQVLTYEVFSYDPVKNAALRLVLFNWLPLVWGVPIWWEQSPMTAAMAPGSMVIPVLTAYADYRVASLVFIQNPAGQYEAFEIVSFTAFAITLSSECLYRYPKGSKVMPVRTAYAKTQTQSRTLITGAARVTVQFTTLDNVDLAAIAPGLTQYLGQVVLDDINFVESELTEGMGRNKVTVIDNASGVIYQQASTDRGRPTTVKTWWTNYASEIWPIRQMFHSFGGNQSTFWLPSNRDDLQLTAPINAGATSLTTEFIGYSLYGVTAAGVPMLPFAHLRITLTNGTKIYCAVTGATASSDGLSEVIAVSAAISGVTLLVSQVQRIEFVHRVRLADDKVTLTHDHPGRAKIVANLVGVKS